jgi:hypothetical protein
MKMWTEEEDYQLIKLWLEGRSDRDIGILLKDRGQNSVHCRRKVLKLGAIGHRTNNTAVNEVIAQSIMSIARELLKKDRELTTTKRNLSVTNRELLRAKPFVPDDEKRLKKIPGLDDEDVEWMRAHRANRQEKEAQRAARARV